MNCRLSLLSLCTLLLVGAGCANIVPPAGGEKDVLPPKLVSVSPADSQLNVRIAKVRFDFDEYIVLTDPAAQVIVSPLLPVQPVITSLNKHVTITFPDSLLLDRTTYHISLGTAVRDNHEGNIYKGPDYIFSTGSYFDSLRLSGRVLNAATGLPDTAATLLLYSAAESDSAVVRHKPQYAVHTDAGGRFAFSALPGKPFRIFALQDKNNNLVFDDPKESIGFLDRTVTPDTGGAAAIELRTFTGIDTVRRPAGGNAEAGSGRTAALPANAAYTVMADTSDVRRRTQDVTRPLAIVFARKPSVDKERIFLALDSAGMTVEAPVTVKEDTSVPYRLLLDTRWTEDAVYTLRLQKGFARDSAGRDLLPGRYTFRTKREEDYARLRIHLPARYYGPDYVMQVSNETDTIYRKPVTDTVVDLLRIAPGSYRIHVIGDRNHNGRWDTGDLFAHLQPELVIPYDQVILLKAGWENQIDFEPAPVPARKSPPDRPAPPVK